MRDVFVDAVVVAGNDACADVGSFVYYGVAKIGEVAGFDALVKPGLLGFDEVADVDVFADFAAGAEASEGTDPGSVRDGAVSEDAALEDQNAVAQSAVF